MLTFAVPWFLAAGVGAALVPLLLHLIRRRPPVVAPLPTARFLSPDPRTSLRLGRPTDLLLLALRMLLPILLGAALSRPAWHPSRRGTADVVLLDRGIASSFWRQAVAEARRRLLGRRSSGALVVFGDSARVLTGRDLSPALFDSLAVDTAGDGIARYSAALRAIPSAVRALPAADSVRVALITEPRWAAWEDGLAAIRRAAWPGAIQTVELPSRVPVDSTARPAASAVYLADDAARATYAVTALEAAGWTVRVAPPSAAAPGDAGLVVVAQPVPAALASILRARAAAGATVLVAAPAAADLSALVGWWGDARPDGAPGALVLEDGTRIAGALWRMTGAPNPPAPLLAAWDDGRAAAVVRRVGRGCVVFAATDLETGAMTLDAAYPHLLSALTRACDGAPGAGTPDAPLDAGARAVLRGSGPRVLAARRVPGAREGVPLGRWLMAAALLVAVAETIRAYGRRRAG